MSGRWPALLPNTLAFLSSCWIMVIELVASRLVARYIGSSVYTWTAVIGVILAGMSLGNHIGGRLADRQLPRVLVGWLFLVSSVMVVFALVLHPTLGSSISNWDFLPWSVRIVLVVTGIFFLPAVALGTIGPVAAKMALEACSEAGRAIGNVYAWGALGSIVGTFLTGFWLISVLGTVSILASSAGILGLIGLLLLGVQRGKAVGVPGGPAALALVALAVIAALPLPGCRAAALERVALERERRIEGLPVSYVRDSIYSHILVRHDKSSEGLPRIALVLDHLIHGFWVPAAPLSLEYEYERVYAALTQALLAEREAGAPFSALYLGGGAYTFPRWIAQVYPQSRNVVAEIDPGVVEANHAAMGLPRDTAIRTLVGDARQVLLREAPGQFALIYGDAFHDLTVPWHLTTREFTAHLKALMTQPGLYLLNAIDLYEPGNPHRSQFVGALLKTCEAVFGAGQTVLYVCLGDVNPEAGRPARTTFVLACALGEEAQRALQTPLEPGARFNPRLITGEERAAMTAPAPLLTDDYAPVEQLLAPVARRG